MTDESLLSELRLDPEQRDGGHGTRTWLIAVLVLLLAAAAGAAVFLLRDRAVLVESALAQPLAAAPAGTTVLDATGYVTARRIATVSSKVTGRLADVTFEEGEHVRQGQVLARLDDTDAKAQLGVARAQVAAARSKLAELRTRLQQAQRDLDRQKTLKQRGLTPEQSLEDARTRVATLAAQIKAQDEQVRVAAAQLNVAKVGVDDTVVHAPFDGVVVAKAAQPGEMVSPISAGGGYTRTGIGTIVDMDSLEIEVDVNEAYIHRVSPGQKVEAVLDAYPDWTIPARVIAIIPTADRSKATVKVRVGFGVKDPRIVPDMGVRVSFLEDKPDGGTKPAQGVLVPAAAVTDRDGRSVVFVIDGDHARLRRVVAGGSNGGMRVIESGIAAGERVIVDPPAEIRDGSPVKRRGSEA